MANIIKIDNAILKRNKRVEKKRKEKTREIRVYFLIVCEGGSHVQVKAIANHIEQQVKEVIGELPYKHEGQQTGQWVLIDYVNVVVHVMHPEARKFYRLEELWSDGVAEEM